MRVHRRNTSLLWMAPVCLTLFSGAVNSQEGKAWPNYRDAPISEVVEAMGQATGRNFILDPQVSATKVTLVTSVPMSPDAYYQAFLSLLSAHGIVAVPSGPVIRLSPDRTMRIYAEVGPDGPLSDELETRVLPVSNVDAQSLVPIVRPMMSPGAHVAAQALGPGAGFAVGRVRDDGLSFAALISAVENTAGANILGTPMLVTLDNQPTEFNVGQQVPFISGSYAGSGINPSSADGQIRPFTTVNRGSVGLNLKITPRINQGDAVRLEINQQLSELAPSVAGAVDLVTNERTLNTAVIVEDGGTLVLGGLIQEKVRESRQSGAVAGPFAPDRRIVPRQRRDA